MIEDSSPVLGSIVIEVPHPPNPPEEVEETGEIKDGVSTNIPSLPLRNSQIQDLGGYTFLQLSKF